MDAPRVAVFIPTYRRPGLLSRAIESVLNQTFADLQLCIYDNASGDETASVVAGYADRDRRVKYHCHAKNLGHAANFDFGLNHVDTPFFLTLSDDDVLLPDCLETLLEGFARYPDAMCSIGSSFDVSSRYVPDGHIDRVPLLLWPRDGYFAPSEGLLYMLRYYPNWASALFRRDVIARVGGICCDNVTIDYDYMMRVAARCPIVVSRKPCALFVMHGGSQSSLAEYTYVWPGWSNILGRLKNEGEVPVSIRQQGEEALTEILKDYLLVLGINSLIMGRMENCRIAASVLRERMGEKGRARTLMALSRVCEASGTMHRLFVGAYGLRSAYARMKNRRVHEENKGYLVFLKIPGCRDKEPVELGIKTVKPLTGRPI